MRFFCFIVLLAVLMVDGSTVAAQTGDPVSQWSAMRIAVDAPARTHIEETRSGPGLDHCRRRLTDQKVAQEVKCLPGGSGESPGNQKLMDLKFEGLHAFKEGDVLGAFREAQLVIPAN